MLGDCEEARTGAKFGGDLGNCLSARTGGKKVGQHSPEVLEICRNAGRDGGVKGREWGVMEGGPTMRVIWAQLLYLLRKAWGGL